MHQWMAYVCESLPTWEFWKFQAPLVAFKYRYLLDALLAMSALHCARQEPRTWMSLEGRMVPGQDNQHAPVVPKPEENGAPRTWKVTQQVLADSGSENGFYAEYARTDAHEMMQLSRKYFDDALNGFQQAVAELSPEKMQGLYMTSVLVSYYSLFILSEGFDNEEDAMALHPIQWFRICRGSLHLVLQWQSFAGNAWISQAGGMYGEPDLTDDVELFRPENRKPFEHLLAPVGGHAILPEDLKAYEDTVSYVGLIYKGLAEKTESPFATCRRIVAFPSRIPERFSELIEASQTRAYIILIHVLALLKLASHEEFPWFKGIAERQVPMLCAPLPPEWAEMVQWPLRIATGQERPGSPVLDERLQAAG